MNCNEEFTIKLLGKLTLELNLDMDVQRKIREQIYLSLHGYEVKTLETSLIASDMEEKIIFFIQVKKLEGYSEKTLKGYYRILMEFSNFMNKPVASVTKNDVRMFLATKAPKLKPSTFNTQTYVIKSFFSWLAVEEIIPFNPTQKLSVNKIPKRLRKSLKVEEIEKLRVACVTNRERALLEFFLSTGCRVSEVMDVYIKDINFHTNTLKVVGKGDKERVVFINDKAKFYITKYLDSRTDENEALFVSDRKPYNRLGVRAMEKMISKLGVRANIGRNIFPHILRHSFATLGLQNGADITTVQHLLGHTSINTSQTYAQQSIDNINHEYKKYFTN